MGLKGEAVPWRLGEGQARAGGLEGWRGLLVCQPACSALLGTANPGLWPSEVAFGDE